MANEPLKMTAGRQRTVFTLDAGRSDARQKRNSKLEEKSVRAY
jgi:hypothetical protein